MPIRAWGVSESKKEKEIRIYIRISFFIGGGLTAGEWPPIFTNKNARSFYKSGRLCL